MASSLQDDSSVLQDELTCPVCLDVYRDPHLLPCGHNFCMSCLRRLKRQAERSRFRCPECRESHRCGATFQKNFKLANIADDYRRRGRTVAAAAKAKDSLVPALGIRPCTKTPPAVPCDYCPAAGGEAVDMGPAGQGGPSGASGCGAGGAMAPPVVVAVKTCLKCEVSMCKEHVRPHLELPAFREHPLTEPLPDLRRRKCQEHDEMFRYYCLEDKVCVCNACTIEGGHSGHTIKTLKNAMKDLRRLVDKQIRDLENKVSRAERKLQEQKEKERENKRFEDETEHRLTALSEELKVKVDLFVASLRGCTLAHCGENGPEIQRNIARIRQDQERLQAVRRGLDSLMQENDPFRFIEAYRTDGKQCRRLLRKGLFYPNYIDMELDALSNRMEHLVQPYVNEIRTMVMAAIESLCPLLPPDEVQPEVESNEDSGAEEEEEDEDDEEEYYDDTSDEEEEMRSEEEEEVHNQSESADSVYSPEGEEEDDDEEDDDDDDEEDDDEEEEEGAV